MRRRRERALEARDASIPAEVARQRFGGVDGPASLAGMVVGMGILTLLAALMTVLGATVATPRAVEQPEAALGGLAVGVLTVFVAFLAGGWAAGRMARYDGSINGLMTGIWALLLLAVSALVGAWAAREHGLVPLVPVPDWMAPWTAGDAAALVGAGAVGAMAAMLLGGFLGGLLGARYHRAADQAIVAATEQLRTATPVRSSEPPPVEEPPPTRSDRELLDERSRLVPPAGEAERRKLAEIDEELRLRGYQPERSGSSGA